METMVSASTYSKLETLMRSIAERATLREGYAMRSSEHFAALMPEDTPCSGGDLSCIVERAAEMGLYLGLAIGRSEAAWSWLQNDAHAFLPLGPLASEVLDREKIFYGVLTRCGIDPEGEFDAEGPLDDRPPSADDLLDGLDT